MTYVPIPGNVDDAYHKLRDWVGPDAHRGLAAVAMSCHHDMTELSRETRIAVLARFPAEPEPSVEGLDWMPAEPSEVEQFSFLADWAARNGCQLDLQGEVGIGRECVGMLRGNSYLDYAHIWDEGHEDPDFWTPDDAYHKHPCMAVLGRGAGPIRQLYDWAKWLDKHGYEVDEVPNRPEGGVLGLLLQGLTKPRLVKRKAAES